jgi:hypothetical protein
MRGLTESPATRRFAQTCKRLGLSDSRECDAYTEQDSGRYVPHLTGVPDAASVAYEEAFFVKNDSRRPQVIPAHNLIVLSGVHGFATCVAAARSASQKGACYVPEGGSGVDPTARGGPIPGLYFMTFLMH